MRRTLVWTVLAGLSVAAVLGGGTAATAAVGPLPSAPAASTTTVAGAIETIYEGADAVADWTGWAVEAWLTGGTSPVATTTADADGAFAVAFDDAVPGDGI
ncbi:MAG TPA: hypothetical protein VI121_03695, partial [Agromyces sp.]